MRQYNIVFDRPFDQPPNDRPTLDSGTWPKTNKKLVKREESEKLIIQNNLKNLEKKIIKMKFCNFVKFGVV